MLEQVWQRYGGLEGDVYVVTSFHDRHENVPWGALNGDMWRTKFDPPLTHYLSSVKDGLYQYEYDSPLAGPNFGVEAVPTNVIINPNNYVILNHAGYSPYRMEQIQKDVDNSLGLRSPSGVTSLVNGGDVDIAWYYSANSPLYSFEKYTIYRNGSRLVDITDKSIKTFKDVAPPTGSHLYQITVSYQKDANKSLVLETAKVNPDQPVWIGEIGSMEWMSYPSKAPTGNIGSWSVWAYGVEFDFGADEFLIKGIEVSHGRNGTVDFAVVDFGKGLERGKNNEIIGNRVIGDLEGTIPVFAEFVPAYQSIQSIQTITGKIAVIITTDSIHALNYNEPNPLADHYTKLSDSEWTQLNSGLGYDKHFHMKLLVENTTSKIVYEATPQSIQEY